MGKYDNIKVLLKGSQMTEEEKDIFISNTEKKVRKMNPGISEAQLMRELIDEVYRLNKKKSSDVMSEEWIIEIFWADQSFNWVEMELEKIKNVVKRDPHEAIKKHMIKKPKDEDWTPDGKLKTYTPLYYWEKSRRTGKKNKMYGKPLPEVAFLRTIGGIAFRVAEPDKGFKLMEMTISGNYADTSHREYKKVVFNQMLNVRASFQEDLGHTYKLKATSATEFNEPNSEYTSVLSEIEEIYADNFVLIKDVDNVFPSIISEEREHGLFSNRICVSECMVVDYQPGSGGVSDRYLVDSPLYFTEDGELDMERNRLYDDEGKELPSYLAWWNPIVPSDFGVGSRIYLFYKMSQKELKDMDKKYTGEWGDIQFSVLGCVVIDRKEKQTKEIESDEQVTEESFIPDIEEVDTIEDGNVEEIVDTYEEIEEVDGGLDF